MPDKDRAASRKEMPMPPRGAKVHDPEFHKLAAEMFRKIDKYLQEEAIPGQDHYDTLEELKRQTVTKYADIMNLMTDFNKLMKKCNGNYQGQDKVLLQYVFAIVKRMSRLQSQLHKIEAATRPAQQRLKELHKKEDQYTSTSPI